MDPAHPRVPPEARVLAGARKVRAFRLEVPGQLQGHSACDGGQLPLVREWRSLRSTRVPRPEPGCLAELGSGRAATPRSGSAPRGGPAPVSVMTGWRLGREPLPLGTPSRPAAGPARAFPVPGGDRSWQSGERVSSGVLVQSHTAGGHRFSKEGRCSPNARPPPVPGAHRTRILSPICPAPLGPAEGWARTLDG